MTMNQMKFTFALAASAFVLSHVAIAGGVVPRDPKFIRCNSPDGTVLSVDSISNVGQVELPRNAALALYNEGILTSGYAPGSEFLKAGLSLVVNRNFVPARTEILNRNVYSTTQAETKKADGFDPNRMIYVEIGTKVRTDSVEVSFRQIESALLRCARTEFRPVYTDALVEVCVEYETLEPRRVLNEERFSVPFVNCK